MVENLVLIVIIVFVIYVIMNKDKLPAIFQRSPAEQKNSCGCASFADLSTQRDALITAINKR
jgi:hypothetical protein